METLSRNSLVLLPLPSWVWRYVTATRFYQPEAEQELADGYHIDNSGTKFGSFFVVIHWDCDHLCIDGDAVLRWLARPVVTAIHLVRAKTAFFMMMFILIRASLPRPRYYQVMSFAGKTACR